jgi:glycosyltransferase involved in cell wall biosynthesis
LISVADAMTDLMVEFGVAPREKFTTIYSGMDVEPFTRAKEHREMTRQKYGFRDEHVVIGKIARLFHLKGHQDLITAAIPVLQRQPNVRFLLVGDGILRETLTQRIAELGLSDHFVFAGLVPPTEVPALIGGMDALVHASYREGLARALPQALIAGLPVISYDVDGAREVAITGQTGILVPAQDVAALSQALETLAVDDPMRQRMGREGQRRFTEQFDHRTMTARVREVYQQQLEDG